MEFISDNERNFTQEESARLEDSVCLSGGEAQEYRLYRRRKNLNEITCAISSSEAVIERGEDIERVCKRAVRLRQASVKVLPTDLVQARYYLTGGRVLLDCIVGGDGETFSKVKAYEARQAVRKRATEISLMLSSSHLRSCKYAEVKKEIKRVLRAVGKIPLKVCALGAFSFPTLARVARIAGEAGARFFSVDYFDDCHRLKADLAVGCGLEVQKVRTLEQFKRLKEWGVERIVTQDALDIYSQWLKQAEEQTTALFERAKACVKEPEIVEIANDAEKGEEPLPAPPVSVEDGLGDEYRCFSENSELKFL